VYYRVWNRTLTQADVLALSGVSGSAITPYIAYVQPLVTTPYAYAKFQPTLAGTNSLSGNVAVGSPLLFNITDRTGRFMTTGTSSQLTYNAVGNNTYTATVFVSPFPSATYATNFPAVPYPSALQQTANTTSRCWTGVAAISPVITKVSALVSRSFGGAAFRFAFNRPLALSFLPGTRTVALSAADEAAVEAGISGGASPLNLTIASVDGGTSTFLLSFNVVPTHPATSAGIYFPAAPSLSWVDFEGVIPYGGPWGEFARLDALLPFRRQLMP